VLLASNRPELLDSAIVRPGRIDRKIYVPRPDEHGAEQIFAIYLKDQPLAKTGLFQRGNGLAGQYAGHAASEVYQKDRPMLAVDFHDGTRTAVQYKDIFSGAAAVSIVNRATDYAFKRAVAGQSSDITFDDLSRAVDKEYVENRTLTSQVTRDDLRRVCGPRFNQIARVTQAYQ
jgi:proteasome-associated ATPase